MASDNRAASELGAGVLAAGGNAVDAAITTALGLGVVQPVSSGIGGGGFAVVYIAKTKKIYTFDFREIGPSEIKPSLYLRDGKVDATLSRKGGLAVGVPGEVAGLDLLSQRFGVLPWSKVVMPAADLAKNGFAVSWFLAKAISVVASRLPSTYRLKRFIQPGGQPLAAGTKVRRLALAKTLRGIAGQRSAGFYRGPVADDIVATVKQAGGVLSKSDLANYKPVERKPLVGSWRGYKIATMPLPSSGGIALLQTFGMLEAGAIDLRKMGAGSSSALHIIAELLKHAFADRARFLGDGQPQGLVDRLLEPKRLKKLARRISTRRTQRSSRYGDKKLGRPTAVKNDKGTSHLCVVDGQGNAVALTTTVNGYFGSGLLTKSSGVVLNNEMDDFLIAKGQANLYGLVQSDFNLVGPGKRPLSSMTPTLVIGDKGVVACAGGSGGPRIISNTIQALLNVLVFGQNAREAVENGRIHHQWKPNVLVVEKDMVTDVRTGLSKKGHKVSVSNFATAVQMIVVDPQGLRHAASDPRKGGAPASSR